MTEEDINSSISQSGCDASGASATQRLLERYLNEKTRAALYAGLGIVVYRENLIRMLDEAATPAPSTVWRDIASAPRDGTRVLVILKDPIPVQGRADLRNWDGRPFVARHMGGVSEWCFAAPVGQGGFPDEWMAGWMPLDPPPVGES